MSVKSPSVRRASTLALAFIFAVLACTPADPDPAAGDASPADTSAAGSETATGTATVPDARVARGELSPGSGVPDSVPLAAVTDSVVHAVAERRWETLAALAHPEHGIRFSPYGYVDTTVTQRLAPNEIAGLGSDTTTRRWGTADGTGDPLVMTFAEYCSRFLYDKPFVSGRRGAPDEVLGRGNSLLNVDEAFPGAQTTFVEYHLEGSEQYSGMDWGSMRVVVTREAGRWYVVGIVNDRWTI